MTIGIDGRLIDETGVGRYIQNLVTELGRLDTKNRYILYTRRPVSVPNSRWSVHLSDVAWHTVSEQIVMPKMFSKDDVDLVHIPYHNPPVLYRRPMVVTIHDLTILHFDTGRATTLPYPLYKLKRLGYRVELALGLGKAKHILAVSETTKSEIVKHLGIVPDKITVTHEAADRELVRIAQKSGPAMYKEPYVLYVGNAYPHKNLDTLLAGYKGRLILACPDDYFSRRLSVTSPLVTVVRAPNTRVLANLYRYATCLVFPSLMEGFGLPGLEAMAIGVPVVCSRIAVFSEIYKDACIMFDPKSPTDIVEKLLKVMSDASLRHSLRLKGKARAKQFSWESLARKTLAVYERSACI